MENLAMTKSSFCAWSIYTGPADVQPIVPDSNWVLGRWNALNNSLQPEQLMKDINARIDSIIYSFNAYCERSTALNKHFAIPEFFFRCKQGPYPMTMINGLQPFTYIKNQVEQRLLTLIKSYTVANTTYTVVLGSILTSNVTDYGAFLQSDEVQERLTKLNQVLSSQIKSKTLELTKKKVALKSKKAEPEHVSWKRQLIYKPHKTVRKAVRLTTQSPTDIDELMKGYRAAPLCTVRNRGVFFYYGTQNFDKPDAEKQLEVRVYEKKYESTVDLTMGVIEGGALTHGDMITQWMANYPSYSTYLGDKQTGAPYQTNSRFDYTQEMYKKLDIGVEICLDHRLQRLRRTVGMNVKNGANLNNYPIYKQFVPSGGMQILSQAVATNGASVTFNADGCEPVYYEYTSSSPTILNGESGSEKSITCGTYALSCQSKWSPSVSLDGQIHYSHSQIAFSTPNSTIGGYNNEFGNKNQQCETYEESGDKVDGLINNLTNNFSVTTLPIVYNINYERKAASSALFCSGHGQIHLYDYKASNTEARVGSSASTRRRS